MRSLQKHQLFHYQKQEKTQGKIGNEKALSKVQKAYNAQGNEISVARSDMRDSYSG
jgi:hypothetical protein